MGLLDTLLNETGNRYAKALNEGMNLADIDSFYDTGSYTLNALMSGDIYKGIPCNKVVALAGDEATGKTFFALSICKQFLSQNPKGIILYFDSEAAVTTKMIEDAGMDTARFSIVPVSTIEDFRHECLKILKKYNELEEKTPCIAVLDSLGMLSTLKEAGDVEADNKTQAGLATRDMTRPGLIRGAFRVLTLELAKANIPLILTNHTYATMSMFSTKEMAGGGGVKYAASIIVFLSKKQIKKKINKLDVKIGNIIKCKQTKGRITKEGSVVEVEIRFDKGLGRYSGLEHFAILSGAWGIQSKKPLKYSYNELVFKPSDIIENPEQYFPEEVLNKINIFVKEKFLYGSDGVIQATDEPEDDEGNIIQPTIEEMVADTPKPKRKRKKKSK